MAFMPALHYALVPLIKAGVTKYPIPLKTGDI